VSTKIYNGYLLDVPDTIGGIINFLRGVGEDACKIADGIAIEHTVNRAALIADAMAASVPMAKLRILDPFGKDHYELRTGDFPLYLAWSEASGRAYATKKSQSRGEFFDLSCSVVITKAMEKGGRGGRGRRLALFYAERKEMRDMWEANPHVKPWPYWDNTDWPKGMTREKWNYRGKKWEEAIGDRPPDQAGLTNILVPAGYWPVIHSKFPGIENAIPSLNGRIKWLKMFTEKTPDELSKALKPSLIPADLTAKLG
jgi:hypothetical protein